MMQRQRPTMSTDLRTDTKHTATSLRLRTSILIGLGITLALTVIEATILLIFASPHQASSSGNHFATLLHLLTAQPLFVVPIGELVAATLLTFLATRSLALLAYLRVAGITQKAYQQRYMPLQTRIHIHKASETNETNQQDRQPLTLTTHEEATSILDVLHKQDVHTLILSEPGMGATSALRVYQYEATRHPLQLVLKHGRLPIYVPLKNYSCYLKTHEQSAVSAPDSDATNEPQQVTLLNFISGSDLPGIQRLTYYIQQLADRGQLLLLCDGLNEVDDYYRTRIGAELVQWMRDTSNRLVLTCRESDYPTQPEFEQLMNEGQATRVVVDSLQSEQVNTVVEHYIERQDTHWQHTAGQIMQVIEHSRLRYHCGNPMLLFMFMGIIDTIGVEQGKLIDTRGRLLRAHVRQLIEHEQRQPQWSEGAPDEREITRFLSEIAYAARWSNDNNAIQLRISTPAIMDNDDRHRANLAEITDQLAVWLDEHPARQPFAHADITHQPYDDPAQLLRFAIGATLISISPGGILSFCHELMAEYFVAAYFQANYNVKQAAAESINTELLEHVSRWSGPIAIWAGLLDNPLTLAEHFAAHGLRETAYGLQALTLGLICVGVHWMPPQATIQHAITLPESTAEALILALQSKTDREALARIFTRCATEDGQELYHGLLASIMLEGIDDFLLLLDHRTVPDLLFAYLQGIIENIVYEQQVKRLTRILGRLEGSAVEQAAQLSIPATGRSTRLRSAAINILGGTRDAHAIAPLIARLSDAENFITERATNALIRLGADMALGPVLEVLEHTAPAQMGPRLHHAALIILGRFLAEKDNRKRASLLQFHHSVDAIMAVLTSSYQAEPDAQSLALNILVTQGHDTNEETTGDNRHEYLLKALANCLPTQDEMAARNSILALQNIGAPAIPYTIDLLGNQDDTTRMRVLEVITAVRDLRAIPQLLTLLATGSIPVQQHVTEALITYAPESIAGLIDCVLHQTSEVVAERATYILSSIGPTVVEPIINVLFQVVPGRTRYLVQVLAQTHDPRCIPALVTLLHMPQREPLLTIAIVRTLGQFQERQVIAPLLEVLSFSDPQLYVEAIDALTQLGPFALADLINSLDISVETPTTQRIKRVILGMVPFPGTQLIIMLEQYSQRQREQVMEIFQQQGAEAALMLAQNIQYPDDSIRDLIQHTLQAMPGAIVVPALLDILVQPDLRPIASTLLLSYPDAAIPPLVELLGEHKRSELAAQILPQFGPNVLQALVSGLDDRRSMARELSQRIIVTLVRQNRDNATILRAIVQLLHAELPERARDALLRVLTSELADVSQAALLEGLEDAYLVDDVTDAFVLLSHKNNQQHAVLVALIDALTSEQRRRGASTALIKIGAPAVPMVGKLITNADPALARTAQEILREIGAPALDFIWTAHSDSSNLARREAALAIFHAMPTDIIQDELIARLVSDNIDAMGMAVALLLDRIHDELSQRYADQSMIQVLVTYVQTYGVEKTNQRVLALLLLLGDYRVVDQLITTLDEYPQHRKQLLYALLLLGEEAQDMLLTLFQNAATSPTLRAGIAAILGMTTAPDIVADYAQSLARHGIAAKNADIQSPEELAISLQALGGLLAGGHWNTRTLRELRKSSPEGSAAKELFNVLLGQRYEPQLARLQSEIQNEQATRKQVIQEFTQRVLSDQRRVQDLEQEIEQLQQKQEEHRDELRQALQENQETRQRIGRMLSEQRQHTQIVQQLAEERDTLQTELQSTNHNNSVLLKRVERLQEEKELISNQYDRLVQQIHNPNAR